MEIIQVMPSFSSNQILNRLNKVSKSYHKNEVYYMTVCYSLYWYQKVVNRHIRNKAKLLCRSQQTDLFFVRMSYHLDTLQVNDTLQTLLRVLRLLPAAAVSADAD